LAGAFQSPKIARAIPPINIAQQIQTNTHPLFEVSNIELTTGSVRRVLPILRSRSQATNAMITPAILTALNEFRYPALLNQAPIA
jgi:hypothetical protein